jgi:hypothetical protein
MAEGTKRPRTTEPPVQGGGFVTAGDDAWTHQDPDTWARMGAPNATPVRPATERRTGDNGVSKDVPRATISARPAPRAVIGASASRPPTSSAELGRLLGGAKGGDDPSTVVGAIRKTPGGPKPGVSRIDGARMEIVNFDGVGSRAAGGAPAAADEVPQTPASRWDRMLPGHPPIRIVRRARKEAAVGRVTLSVAVIVALAAFAWHQYDLYLESQVTEGSKVIFTTSKPSEVATEGGAEGSGAPQTDAGIAPVGTLTVRSNRTATVYVDGRSAGSAPLETVRIVKGMHEIKLVDEKSLESRTQMVEVLAGQPKNVTISF